MTPGARIQATVEILAETWSGKEPPDRIVDDYFRKRRYAGSSDRRAINDMLYRVIRHRARLDWWIGRTGSAAEPGPRTRVIAELALEDKSSPDDIAAMFSGARHCPEPLSAEETTLATALYGRPLTHEDMSRSVALEYPDWMDRSLSQLWGDDLARQMSALNQPAPVDLRVNLLKATREQAHASLTSEFIEAEPTALSPIGLRLKGRPRLAGTAAFRKGWVEVQDEGSQLISLLVGAHPGMRVVDFCAGGGGKALAIAGAMADAGAVHGEIWACDISGFRLERMIPRLQRAGAEAVRTKVVAARNDPWVDENAGTMDRVLADVPCTGTGAWRRDPDARWRFTPDDLDDLMGVQQRILGMAARLIRPGGRLIYATCSLLQEENERQFAWFLENHSDFRALPIDEVWAETVGGPPPPSGPCLRLSPASTGTDGFFCAVAERA
ncbi:MAG TPA: RsmB/NOP family class I SAM-dependent RNA methyltransferase [Rhodospirillales bacterium]